MRNRKAVIMIGFSALMGLVAVFIAAKWLGQKSMLATSQVVVASRDVQLGTALSADMMKTAEWPSNALPDGAFTDMKSLETRVVRTGLQRGELVLAARLAPIGTKGGLSSVISEGKRAVSVRVNEVVGVAGFALPGNLVDVMVNAKDANDKPVSKIVLEQILVLAVAQEANRDETKPKVVSAVTLELSPEQAERLDLARSIGNLSLVLRNQLDKLPVQTAGVRAGDLLQTQVKETPEPKATPVVAAPPRRAAKPVAATDSRGKLEVIRGTHKTNAEF